MHRDFRLKNDFSNNESADGKRDEKNTMCSREIDIDERLVVS